MVIEPARAHNSALSNFGTVADDVTDAEAAQADYAMPWSDEPVRVVAYGPTWPARFEAERSVLEAAIGDWVVAGIHHVGSTAVPGLAAKPIIDILVGARGLASSRGCSDQLAKIGYLYAPYRLTRCIGPESPHRLAEPIIAPLM